jgi:transposase
MMARQGVIIERSTLSFWMGYAAAEIAPVVARLREMLLGIDPPWWTVVGLG